MTNKAPVQFKKVKSSQNSNFFTFLVFKIIWNPGCTKIPTRISSLKDQSISTLQLFHIQLLIKPAIGKALFVGHEDNISREITEGFL